MVTATDKETKAKTRGIKPYLVGLVLCYVFSVVGFGRMFSAGASESLQIALFGGLFVFPFLAAPHVLFQFLAGKIVNRFWQWGQKNGIFILNLPVCVLIVLASISAWQEPKTAFRFFIADPIPDSVKIVQFSRHQGIGDPMNLKLAFEIQTNDLTNIFQSGGYVETNGIIVSLFGSLTNFQRLFVSSKYSNRHLLIASNETNVIFILAPNALRPAQ